MKCIRILKNDEIKRVSDEEATRLVDSFKAVYVPKSLYKTLLKPKKDEKVKK